MGILVEKRGVRRRGSRVAVEEEREVLGRSHVALNFIGWGRMLPQRSLAEFELHVSLWRLV